MVGGDGIGPEVIAEALKVVDAAGVVIETVDYDLGAGRYERTGEVLPDSVLDELRDADAILLGAVGPPIGSTAVPPGVIERGLLLRLRFELDLYINLRPFNGAPGSIAPDADFVVVRENTEGPYVGEGGALRRGTPFEVATQGSVNTRHGVERCVRYAFGLAERRKRHHVTLVHKTNVLTYAGDLWQRSFDSVALEHPGVATAYNHVDAACIVFVENATTSWLPTTCSATSSPTSRAPSPVASGSRLRPTSTRRAPGRPYSNRSTVARTTSPAPGRQIHLRRSAPRR